MPTIDKGDIESRIKRHGAEGEAPPIDIALVKALGIERKQGRRKALAALGGLGVLGIAGLVAAATIGADGNPQSVPTTHESVPTSMRPGCAPFGASLVEQVTPGAATIHSLNAKVNSALTLNAVVPDAPNARYTMLKVIIAVPGATIDVGPVDQLPATSAGRPENQLSSELIVSPGRTIKTSARSPATPGSYPIVAYGQYVTSVDCNSPVPTDPKKQQTGTYAFEMGTLVVNP
jgi:hypothetical protein